MLHNKIRIIKAAGAAVLALAMMNTMNGCTGSIIDLKPSENKPSENISFWNGYSETESRQLVEDALEEKYGEAFVVDEIGTKSGGSWDAPGSLTAICYPKDNETVYFEAEYFEYGDNYDLDDVYIQSIVRKQIKDVIDPVLAEHFDDFATEVYIYGLASGYDSGITNSEEVTIASFARATNQEDKRNLSTIRIVLNENQIQPDVKMSSLLTELNDLIHGLNTVIHISYVPEEVLIKCKEISNAHQYTQTTIEKYVNYDYLEHVYAFDDEKQQFVFLESINYKELKEELEKSKGDKN